jgi:hypothetical protein
VDKYGQVHTISDLQSPDKVRISNNKDVFAEVYKKDSLYYFPDTLAKNSMLENIELEFKKPNNTKNAKLIVKAKNTLWLDYVYGEFYELFGIDFPRWYKRQTKRSPERLKTWALDQGIPISIYIEKEYEWEFVDYFNIAGPIAFKDDVLPLDLSDIESDIIKIKLEFGSLFWIIDYIAMDFTEDLQVEKIVVPLESAIDKSGKNVMDLLKKDDSLYYTQTYIGDEAVLTFKVPEISEKNNRSVCLHSKGYYEILRYPQGKREIAHINSYLKPGWFLEFSKEKFNQLNKYINSEK